MDWLRPLGRTGIQVSALGLGTVKFGRNRTVKYPQAFELPDNRSVANLLHRARDLGINLLDTAPAYGSSEERLGDLLAGDRQRWVISTKVGEEFEDGHSHFDFSAKHTRNSVQRSLRRLRTDVIDIVLVHSDGNDLEIFHQTDALSELQKMKREGLIRAYGVSTKTVEGGLVAARECDVVMLTYNPGQREALAVLEACSQANCGALIKKALASGHLAKDVSKRFTAVQASMDLVFEHPGSSAAVVGTLNQSHMETNVRAARRAIEVRPG